MEDKRTERLDILLRTKSYDDLNDDDKVIVSELLGTRKEYEKVSSTIRSISKEAYVPVDKEVKQALIDKMKSKNKPYAWGVLNYKVPAYLAIMAFLLFSMAIYMYSPEQQIYIERVVKIPSPTVIDTVLIMSQPDTVFIEKIVKVNVPVYLTSEKKEPVIQTENSPIKQVNLRGKSLADQKELRSLLGQSLE